EKINGVRLENSCRIDYYGDLSKNLSDGLSIINEINETMSKSGITEEELKHQRRLLNENRTLRENNQELKNQVQSELGKAEKTFNRWALFFTIFIVFVTSVGMTFDGFFTQKLLDSRMELNITDAPVIKYQDLDKIKQ
ncbi:hypothetical protein CYQ88_11310, partial [Hydrogenovibrio sp. SC-1]|uniref:hypothetical protein n=1 Tax=Hydrogenovibrio sp. SC-1 TaxID=2065820 RepID=UPI000CBFF80C